MIDIEQQKEFENDIIKPVVLAGLMTIFVTVLAFIIF